MGDFGYKYAKSRPTKYRGQHSSNINKVNSHQENNYIVKHTADEIIMKEDNKVSAEEETHENIEYYFYENDLYQIDNMSLGDKK